MLKSLVDEDLMVYYNYLKSQKRFTQKELENLLKKDDLYSKRQFIEGYLYYSFVFSFNVYSKFTTSANINENYTVMDFIQDANLFLIDLIYNKKYSNNIELFNLYYWYKLKHILEKSIILSNVPKDKEYSAIIKKAQEDFYNINQREATIEELVELTSINKDIIKRVLSIKVCYLNDFNDEELANMIGYDDVLEKIINQSMRIETSKVVEECLMCLSERSREFIHRIYGFNGANIETLTHIAEENNISRQAVHRIKERALVKIYKKNSKKLENYRKNNY